MGFFAFHVNKIEFFSRLGRNKAFKYHLAIMSTDMSADDQTNKYSGLSQKHLQNINSYKKAKKFIRLFFELVDLDKDFITSLCESCSYATQRQQREAVMKTLHKSMTKGGAVFPTESPKVQCEGYDDDVLTGRSFK